MFFQVSSMCSIFPVYIELKRDKRRPTRGRPIPRPKEERRDWNARKAQAEKTQQQFLVVLFFFSPTERHRSLRSLS